MADAAFSAAKGLGILVDDDLILSSVTLTPPKPEDGDEIYRAMYTKLFKHIGWRVRKINQTSVKSRQEYSSATYSLQEGAEVTLQMVSNLQFRKSVDFCCKSFV